MKGLKKLLTGVLAATMIMSASFTAFAAENTTAVAQEQQVAGTNSITVTDAVEGETYNIYRMLDLEVSKAALATENSESGYSYTINTDWAAFWSGNGAAYITKTTKGDKTYVTWNKDKATAADMEEFGKKAAAWAKDKGLEVKEAVTAGVDKKVEFKGLVNGYYMVTSTLGSAVSIGSTPSNPAAQIKEKNKETTTEKEVLENETNKYGKENDAQIGDTVTFRSVVHVSKNQINVAYHDTMTVGLTYQGDAKVYSDEACKNEITSGFEVRTGNQLEKGEAGETFVVDFDNNFIAGLTFGEGDNPTADLYIKYTAKLNNKAAVVDAEGKPVIENNTPKVTFGNGGSQTGEPTKTKTYKFAILKYDGVKYPTGKENNIQPLAGAKFKLFDNFDEKNPKLVKLAVSDDGLTYRVLNDGEDLPKGFTAAVNNEIVTVATDKITVLGVDNRKYYLVETEAPLGFNKIDGNTDITIETDNSLLEKIPNLSGSLLPSTGGMGTTIFYILGGILIVAGVAYFIVRRKANAE